MTFKQLQDDVLERTGLDNVSTSSTSRTRVKRLLNIWHRRVLSDPRFSRLREGSIGLSSVANLAVYALPPGIQVIRRIRQTSTGQVLPERSVDWYRRSGLGLSLGTPQFYCPLGFTALQQGYTSGTGLWAASSSAADTTQKINVDTIRAGGYLQSLTETTLNGVTKVAVQAAITDVIDVVKFSVTPVTAGSVSLYNGSTGGATELARISVGHTQSRYQSLLLVPPPSSVLAYEIDYTRGVQDLIADGDEPLWGEDFHWLLSSCARYEEFVARKDIRIAEQIWGREIAPGMSTMLGSVLDDVLIVPDDGRSPQLGLSNLGGSFPRGIW